MGPGQDERACARLFRLGMSLLVIGNFHGDVFMTSMNAAVAGLLQRGQE